MRLSSAAVCVRSFAACPSCSYRGLRRRRHLVARSLSCACQRGGGQQMHHMGQRRFLLRNFKRKSGELSAKRGERAPSDLELGARVVPLLACWLLRNGKLVGSCAETSCAWTGAQCGRRQRTMAPPLLLLLLLLQPLRLRRGRCTWRRVVPGQRESHKQVHCV